ncbi:MAG TPA: hypothetical protein VML58_12570 [Burkholderiaceae bacterium]|nr:hypothetical protein [Burkholderiaceae bacterium]
MAPTTLPKLLSSTTILLALAGAAAVAAPTDVVWVDNDSFALNGCAGSDELPGSEDPQVLMRALRERGLADAAVRLNGRPASSATLTPISASLRCDGAPSSVVFRLSTFDRSGQATTSNLVSRLPAPGTPVASNR